MGRTGPVDGAGQSGRHHRQPRLCHGHASGHPAGCLHGKNAIAAPEGQPAADGEHRGGPVCPQSFVEDAPYRAGRCEPAEQGRA